MKGELIGPNHELTTPEGKSLGDRNRIEQTDEFDYRKFANMPEVRVVSGGLVLRALEMLPKKFTHVDIATGTGLIPEQIAHFCWQQNRKAKIIGIDPDGHAIEKAREFNQNTPFAHFKFIQGFGQELKTLLAGEIPPSGVDWTGIQDGIHEIPGKDTKQGVITSMAEVLRPGGIFTMNSAFTTEAMQGAMLKWGKWKSTAFSLLGQKQDKSIEDIEIHTPDQYRQMVEKAGLTVIYECTQFVNLTREALEAISEYPEFIKGVFRDMYNTEKYSPKEKSNKLKEALEKRQILGLKRNWWEIIAEKKIVGGPSNRVSLSTAS